MKPLSDATVGVALRQHRLLLPLAHQTHGLVPDPLRVVAGVVGAVVVAHVRARPVGRRKPGVVGHPGSLIEDKKCRTVDLSLEPWS